MGAPTTTETIAVGAPGPVFDGLWGVDGRTYSMESFADRALLTIVFVSNGCPTVREYGDRLEGLQERYGPEGLQLVLVNSNDPHLSPGDSLASMIRRVEQTGLNLPYLRDRDGELARGFGAVCTPHAFLLDADRVLRYRGRIDDARLPENVTVRDLEAAIEDLLEGREVTVRETDPFGCAIVW